MSLSNIKVNNTLVTSVDDTPIENSTNLINSKGAFNLIRYSVFPGRVSGEKGKWVLNQGCHIVIKIYPDAIVRVITDSTDGFALYVCKDYYPKNGTELNLSDVSDFNKRVSITSDSDISLTMPFDAKYIVLFNYSDNTFPKNMTINGFDYRLFAEDKSLIKECVGNAQYYTYKPGLIRPISGLFVWDLSSGIMKCAIIPVKPGDHIIMEPDAEACFTAVLRSYSTPIHGEVPDFSLVAGFTSRIEVSNELDLYMPSDANFLYVSLTYINNISFAPYLMINGISYFGGTDYAFKRIDKSLNGYKLWSGTQSEYDNISSHDNKTIYFITENV